MTMIKRLRARICVQVVLLNTELTNVLLTPEVHFVLL